MVNVVNVLTLNTPIVVELINFLFELKSCYLRFGESVMVLLPQLELALRRIFVSINDCPERLLTAEVVRH